MRKKFNQWIGVAVLALLPMAGVGAGDAWAAGEVSMAGQILGGEVDEKALAEGATPRRVNPAAAIERQIRLAPYAAAEIFEKSEPIKGFLGPIKIGTHREMPASVRTAMNGHDLVWEPGRNGGQVAVFSLTSPGAKALRLALDFGRLPRGAEVRFYSPAEPVAQGGSFDASFLTTFDKALDTDGPFWSPAVHGETAIVEIWVPTARRVPAVEVSVRQVSHIYRSLAAKDLDDLGRSGSCNKNVACFKKWTMAGDAVAKIMFDFGGGTALCTGQLMANGKGRFLFLTAAHCISSSREAGSTGFFWKFQRASCSGGNPTSVMQSGGGGKLLFTSRSSSQGLVTDHTLMELKRDPTAVAGALPGLGWVVSGDPDSNLRMKIHGVHHPSGDAKMGSRGKVKDTWQLLPDSSLSGATPPTHYEVQWKKGTTEGGSSGSSIMIGKRWPEQFVIGVLTGGLASCSAKRDPDFYGLFEETFRRNKKFRKHFE